MLILAPIPILDPMSQIMIRDAITVDSITSSSSSVQISKSVIVGLVFLILISTVVLSLVLWILFRRPSKSSSRPSRRCCDFKFLRKLRRSGRNVSKIPDGNVEQGKVVSPVVADDGYESDDSGEGDCQAVEQQVDGKRVLTVRNP